MDLEVEGIGVLREGEEFKLFSGCITLWYRRLRETLCTFISNMDTRWLDCF